jgi:hypothetical protein
MCNYQVRQEDISKETTTTERCIKIWSEKGNKWRYIPKDPAYFRNKYYEYRGDKTCAICGTVITTQMCRHTRSKRCQLVRQGINNTIEQMEDALTCEQKWLKEILEDKL